MQFLLIEKLKRLCLFISLVKKGKEKYMLLLSVLYVHISIIKSCVGGGIRGGGGRFFISTTRFILRRTQFFIATLLSWKLCYNVMESFLEYL